MTKQEITDLIISKWDDADIEIDPSHGYLIVTREDYDYGSFYYRLTSHKTLQDLEDYWLEVKNNTDDPSWEPHMAFDLNTGALIN